MKGKVNMAIAPDSLPVVTPVDYAQGPTQGKWIYKDYLSLPDDGQRYEIVNGVLFMAPSPNRWHQKAAGRIFAYLLEYVEDAGLGEVYDAPFDVLLAPDVVVQPDVLVVLNANREKITDKGIVGAPDLVVEVTSPGTATYDRHTKYVAYASARVPEYWIVDPAGRTVEVLVLEDDEYRTRGVFQGKAALPSQVVPGFLVRVEQFFV
jgi:Uma2 family endonuclease